MLSSEQHALTASFPLVICQLMPVTRLLPIIAAFRTEDHDVIKGNETATSRTKPAGAGAQTSSANKVGFSRRRSVRNEHCAHDCSASFSRGTRGHGSSVRKVTDCMRPRFELRRRDRKCHSHIQIVLSNGSFLVNEGVGVRVPIRSRIFSSPRRPDRLWGPPNLLSNGYRELFPRG
jgi:hypothetical protein